MQVQTYQQDVNQQTKHHLFEHLNSSLLFLTMKNVIALPFKVLLKKLVNQFKFEREKVETEASHMYQNMPRIFSFV